MHKAVVEKERTKKNCFYFCGFLHDIRGLERCSRVYPARALDNSSMLCSGTTSFELPPPCCAAATSTERLPVPPEACQTQSQ